MTDVSPLISIEDNIVRSNVAFHVDPADSVPAAIFRSLKPNPDKKVMVDAASGRTWTGSCLSSAIAKAVRVWSSLIGLVKGEAAAFCCPNSDWHAINLVAISALGGIFTAGHDDYKYDEFKRLVRDAGAVYIIASGKSLDNALRIKRELNGQVRKVLLLDLHQYSPQHNGMSVTSCNSGSEYDSILPLVHQVVEHADLTAVTIDAFKDVMAILFSSGTTGMPKAVLKTHSSLLSCMSLRLPGFDFLPLAEDDHVTSCHSHFGHVGGLTLILLSLMSGSVACVIDTFSVPKFLQAVNDHAITTVFSVPSYVTQLVRFLQHLDNRSAVSRLNLSSLADFLIAGEFMPREISLPLLLILPHVKRFRQSFGSTELGFAAIVPADMSNESNVLSSGIPSPGFAIRIMPRRDQDQGSGGEQGMPLSRHQVGEICAKGPQMTTGYLNNPAANSESFDQDGFFHTGDGGCFDERGFLFVSDRFKEIIKFDGMQVSPAELESILLSHAAVQEAAVIGIPHPVHGHVPRAFVVLKTTRDSCDSCSLSSKSLAGEDQAATVAAGCGDERLEVGVAGKKQTTTQRATVSATSGTTKVTEDQSSHNPGSSSIVNELMHFVSNQVSSYKQIRGGILILPTFQRTVLGKIDRKFLRNNFSLSREELTGEVRRRL